MAEQTFYLVSGSADGLEATGSVPDHPASEFAAVQIDSNPTEHGLVKVTCHMEVTLTTDCAKSLISQLGAGNPSTRTAQVLWLLCAGDPDWVRQFRQSTKDVIRFAKVISDSIDLQ